MQAVLKVQAHKVLFDEAVVASYFPRVNVVYITGEKTHFQCMWAFFTTERLYKEALGRGEVPRSIRFKLVPEGNHFIHYDMPERLMQEIVEGCNSNLK
ncbi:hypothetical protein B0H11DRAFT_2248046 [Mycena galericulata]|nr:hypothetical protein B0H11DRAFT_2248046 [Mycena galericulata]